jgi:hypothetical protein
MFLISPLSPQLGESGRSSIRGAERLIVVESGRYQIGAFKSSPA